jgi:DNA-binding SARP family transcriptional activator/tetratricopeptide (TPR) repeat protein
VRLGILGPLLVVDDAGGEIPVAVRQRTLLAALLVHANRTVAVEQLAEAVWDGRPPDCAVRTLRTYMVRLRQAVGPGIAARIETHGPGYLVRVSADELDVLEFERLCRAAAAALRAGARAEAADAAEGALGLWRGEPLLDVPSQLLRDSAGPHLEQLRVNALEDRAEAGLQLGWHEQLVPGLRELAREHPLRERFCAQLMLALYRSGRQAEALEAYQGARRALAGQLGIEPGPQLRRLHERILAGDETGLAAPAPAGQAAPPAAAHLPRPRQLPAAAAHFTGRLAELEWLTGLAGLPAPAPAAGGTVVISAIDGMAGIGKTALAVHAAHRLSGRFPGGQLFIDLHGYTRGRPPREPGEALGIFLRVLGVPAGQVPGDLEECAALYRQYLAGTQTLIVLDNAVSEAQVRPLLPADPGCLVLVTSRRRLKGLDDARSLSLDLLPPAEAAALLRAVAGPGRIPDGTALAEIAGLCGRLPLALRIAAALLRHRPAWSPGHLAGLLAGRHQGVHVLADGERDLGAVFDLSYRALGGRHRLLFRRLGLVPGPDADAYAAAALLECDPGAATGLLEDLADHNLLIAHAPGRYRLHDLIRAHARALAGQHDPAADRQAAAGRLLHYYAHTAQLASIPLARLPRPAPEGPAPAHRPALPGTETARAWLRAERDNLEAASAHARVCALDSHLIALAAGLAEILRADGPFTRALDLHQAAADAAQRDGRPAAQATALTDLGTARYLAGDLPGADAVLTQALEICREACHRPGEARALAELGTVRHLAGDLPGADAALTQALEIFRAIGHRHGEARALAELGTVRYLAGDLPGAGAALTQALEIYRATGHRPGEAHALVELGTVLHMAGDLPGAGTALTQALEIFRATGHRHGEARTLAGLGAVRRLAGDLPGAGTALTQALEICRETGHRPSEAYTLTWLGTVRRLAGDLPGAGTALTRALEIYRETGHRNNEAWALNPYAATVAADGDLPRALALYRQALAMNRELDKPDDEAISLEGIGECLLAEGSAGEGTARLRQALEIFQRLGMTLDAERVRTGIANLAAQ